MPTIDPVGAFTKLFRAQILLVPEVVTCIGTAKLFNAIAEAGTKGTYAVYQVIPLQDSTGQARSSILTRLLCDLKFISKLPVDPNIAAAVYAVKEHFRASNTFDADGYRISIRHERPIEIAEVGASADDRRIHRGGTFHAWIS
jgi:hypothetical protein